MGFPRCYGSKDVETVQETTRASSQRRVRGNATILGRGGTSGDLPLSWRKAEEMKSANVFLGRFLFVVMTTFFFGTEGVSASHEFIISEQAVGQAEAEALLTFRIEEVVEHRSPSVCAVVRE